MDKNVLTVYFYSQCTENYGMFARQTQLILLDEAGNRTEPVSPSSAGSNATTPDDSAARARSRLNRWVFLDTALKSFDYIEKNKSLQTICIPYFFCNKCNSKLWIYCCYKHMLAI